MSLDVKGLSCVRNIRINQVKWLMELKIFKLVGKKLASSHQTFDYSSIKVKV